MIPKKTFNNLTILQKLKEDNSIRNLRKLFIKTPTKEYHYDIPHTLPLQVEPLTLDDSSSARL
jgi:hypothetical protein